MIELVPLCVAELGIGRPIDLGTTPAGRRLIGLADGGRFDGDRLHAKVAAVGADWLVIEPDGTGMVDARLLLETDEGALIHVTYQGRVDTTGGMRGPFYTAPLFENDKRTERAFARCRDGTKHRRSGTLRPDLRCE